MINNFKNGTKSAAVFILLGQSNASGHAAPMRDEDKITTPLRNVFGLSRAKNQSFDNTELTWENYVSAGMNLGENLDDTYSLANCLAQAWQNEIDTGNRLGLPDLHIIQIAVGSHGVGEKYMWYPDKPKVLVPGTHRTSDIALYSLSKHVLSLVSRSLAELGKHPERVMLHWRGGEEDANHKKEEIELTIPGIYKRIFAGLRESLGLPCDITLHKFRYKERCYAWDPSGESYRSMLYINDLFDSLAAELDDTVCFDIADAPFFETDTPHHGVYSEEDLIHYTERANRYVAEEIIKRYK